MTWPTWPAWVSAAWSPARRSFFLVASVAKYENSKQKNRIIWQKQGRAIQEHTKIIHSISKKKHPKKQAAVHSGKQKRMFLQNGFFLKKTQNYLAQPSSWKKSWHKKISSNVQKHAHAQNQLQGKYNYRNCTSARTTEQGYANTRFAATPSSAAGGSLGFGTGLGGSGPFWCVKKEGRRRRKVHSTPPQKKKSTKEKPFPEKQGLRADDEEDQRGAKKETQSWRSGRRRRRGRGGSWPSQPVLARFFYLPFWRHAKVYSTG